MRHVTYERVHNLRKSTHVLEEEGSIVNELNVFDFLLTAEQDTVFIHDAAFFMHVCAFA